MVKKITDETEEEILSVDLSDDEKRELEADAKREVMRSMKAAKADQFKENAKKRIQAEALFRSGKDDKGDDLVTIDLTLASYPKYIMLDGAVYHSGRSYTKKRSVISVLADQMERGWRQEEARRGEKVEMQPRSPFQGRVLNRHGLQ